MLSPRQLEAAHRIGQDVCVIAGPGSGKTSVLIERFRWLVTVRDVPPERILAITFTEKAATEIKQRMILAFADRRDLRERIERAWVSTIHSFCARLLRENAIEAGVDPQFTVLERSAKLLRDSADDALENMYSAGPDRMRHFLHSLAVGTERDGFVPDLASSLVSIYETLRLAGASPDCVLRSMPEPPPDWENLQDILRTIAAERPHLKTPKQINAHAAVREWAAAMLELPDQVGRRHFELLRQARYSKTSLVKGSVAHTERDAVDGLAKRLRGSWIVEYYASERVLVQEALNGLDRLYRERKRAQSGLDFDDLEEAAIALLESDPELRQSVRADFDFILMDELQDTNPLQWRLMDLVRRENNFFAVGDVNQSIFGFRHAAPQLFHRYRATLASQGKAIDELRDNWRSREAVLDAVNAVLDGEAGVEPHRLVSARIFPSKAAPSIEKTVVPAANNEEGEHVEALWVARRISELVGALPLESGPARYRDFAILTRANAATGALQRALDQFQVPSLVLGGLTFFDTREVRDLILLLQVLVNPLNEVALAGLLRSPIFGMTDEDLMRMSQKGGIAQAIADNPPPFWAAIESLREIRNQVSPDRLLQRVLDECDYESELSERGRANVEKLLATLRARYAAVPLPLAEMVEEIENAPPEAEAPPNDYGDAVRLMTIHKAKGLEFPVVFLPYLHRSRPSEFPIVNYSHEHGLGLRWRDPATGDPVSDFTWSLNNQASTAAQEQEENRLLYVAMTRAKEHLVLSWSETPRARGRWTPLVQAKLAGLPVVESVEEKPASAAASGGWRNASANFVYLPRVDETIHGDSSASVTDISRFVECPRRYYLERYLRWPQSPPARPLADIEEIDEFPRPDIDASELGRQVHKILAHEPLESASREAVELADRFLTSPMGRRVANAVNKAHEWDFLMEVDGLVLRGQVDLWFEHNRELIVVDYKTDHVSSPVTREKITGYELQLQIYALALERAMGRAIDRGYLCFLRPNELVEVDLHPLSLGAARETVRGFRKAQSQASYPLREGEQCVRCPFYSGLCPAGRPAQPQLQGSAGPPVLHVLDHHR